MLIKIGLNILATAETEIIREHEYDHIMRIVRISSLKTEKDELIR